MSSLTAASMATRSVPPAPRTRKTHEQQTTTFNARRPVIASNITSLAPDAPPPPQHLRKPLTQPFSTTAPPPVLSLKAIEPHRDAPHVESSLERARGPKTSPKNVSGTTTVVRDPPYAVAEKFYQRGTMLREEPRPPHMKNRSSHDILSPDTASPFYVAPTVTQLFIEEFANLYSGPIHYNKNAH